MEFNQFTNLIKEKKQTIVSIVLIVVLIVSVATFSQSLKYGSSSRLLIVQNLPAGTDPYAIARSNEMITNVLSEVLESDSFYNEVINSDFNIDRSYFRQSNDSKREMKRWANTVDAKALNDRGMIDIKVYHPDRYQVNQISQAINYVYQTKNSEYHGLGRMVTIRVINQPYVSNWPVKPNVLLNYGFGLLLAFFIALVYVYIFPEKRYDIRLWPKRKPRSGIDYGYIAKEPILAYADNNNAYEQASEGPNGLEEALADEPVYFEGRESNIENVLVDNYQSDESVEPGYSGNETRDEVLDNFEANDLENKKEREENNRYLQRGGDIKNVID